MLSSVFVHRLLLIDSKKRSSTILVPDGLQVRVVKVVEGSSTADAARDSDEDYVTVESAPKTDTFTCPVDGCGFTTKRFGPLSQHVRMSAHKDHPDIHHLKCILEQMEPKDRYGFTKIECPLCKEIRPGKSILKHMNVWHSTVVPAEKYKQALKECTRQIRDTHLSLRADQAKRRAEASKQGDQLFVCPHCSKTFDNQVYCMRHARYWCKENAERVRIFFCKLCHFQSVDESMVNEHMEKKHPVKRERSKSGASKQRNEHSSHETTKEVEHITCGYKNCGFSTRYDTALKRHTAMVHGCTEREDAAETFICEHCGEVSTSRIQHDLHMHYHSSKYLWWHKSFIHVDDMFIIQTGNTTYAAFVLRSTSCGRA
jgi:hypothetical protein